MTSYNDSDAACDPFLRPAWRFNVVEELATVKIEKKRLKYLRVDPCLLQYADELRANGRFLNDDANAAYDVFRANGEQRAEIEARVLTGQDPAAIAECVQVPESVVSLYEYLFFDVRVRLGARYWLAIRIYRVLPANVSPVDSLRAFWSRFALAGGPVVLDVLIKVYKDSRNESDPFSVAFYLKDESTIPLEIQHAAALWVIPSSPDTRMFEIQVGTELQLVRKMQFPISRSVALEALAQKIVEEGRLHAFDRPRPKPRRQRASLKRGMNVLLRV